MAKIETALFFGSFNPIHIGHLIIASFLKDRCALKEVWFVVSPHNPLKEKESLLRDYDRLHLVRLAIEDNPVFKVSDIEFSLPKPSYTVDSLLALKEKFPSRNFSLIMGEDNLASLPKWKNYQQLLENKIYVYKRAGSDHSSLKDHHNVNLVDVPLLNISASFIRTCIKQSISVRYLLPEKVWEYVDANRLYR